MSGENAGATADDLDLWFKSFAGHEPHPWQAELLREGGCGSRLIRIPTGFGKTLGVLAAWTRHRLVERRPDWPRRLVLCLPMRVLVEQTEDVVRGALERSGLLRNANGVGAAVHVLLGGLAAGEWHLDVEGDAVLIGTQDMLLSKALNRGFAAARARWPVEFGLLHQDALWVLDEVQLMDVGLATSAQLETFVAGAPNSLRPNAYWWMSATLQRSWLRSVDTSPRMDALPLTSIPSAARQGRLWNGVVKPVRCEGVDATPKDLAAAMGQIVLTGWRSLSNRKTLALVIVNTVERACAVHAFLAKAFGKESGPPDLRLVHSRFRPAERAQWRVEFLRRDAALPAQGRIVVATQVVEAGVDLDASLLVTELAPWPSLVQRFGRAARGGGRAEVVVVDPGFDEERAAAPYAPAELEGARIALQSIADVSPSCLEAFEEAASHEQIRNLYPYRAAHLLLRREVDELFDTTPDLTGADLDISRYIRSGEERDCTVAWFNVDKRGPPAELQPPREALCPVPFLRARAWLCGEKGERLKKGVNAWVWDWLDGAWQPVTRSVILPGRTILVAADVGGYDATRGFDPLSDVPVEPVSGSLAPSREDIADAAQDGEPQSEFAYKTIGTHGGEVAAEATHLADSLQLPGRYRRALRIAGLWHDLGKAHPAFQGSIRASTRPGRQDLAKAPDDAWPRAVLYQLEGTAERRRGFRHELASMLGLFAVLQTHAPDHPALLGPWTEILGVPPPPTGEQPTDAERELLELLEPGLFDLVAYLVVSHHGKVRATLHASPADQDYRDKDGLGLPIRGVREGDQLPPTQLDPTGPSLPALTLTLEPAALGLSSSTGRSWTERVALLLDTEGPFALAFLEACLRAADVRASRLATADPVLVGPS